MLYFPHVINAFFAANGRGHLGHLRQMCCKWRLPLLTVWKYEMGCKIVGNHSDLLGNGKLSRIMIHFGMEMQIDVLIMEKKRLKMILIIRVPSIPLNLTKLMKDRFLTLPITARMIIADLQRSRQLLLWDERKQKIYVTEGIIMRLGFALLRNHQKRRKKGTD